MTTNQPQTMQDYELDAYLGDTAAQVTAEQRDALHAAFTAIAARYPDPDLDDSRERAFSTAAMVVLGDCTLEDISADWRDAYRVAAERHDAMTGALIVSAGTDVALAERAGVSRMTVRKALGK